MDALSNSVGLTTYGRHLPNLEQHDPHKEVAIAAFDSSPSTSETLGNKSSVVTPSAEQTQITEAR